MPLSIGIIGMPNVGKSTLFNALTGAGAESSNYPFCTIDRNVGIVEVPDERLLKLKEALKPKECTPATVTFIDIAGLVRGASRGEGLGNRFLAHIREVDAIVHVLRCFQDEDIAHVDGSIDPLRDLEVVEVELALADLEVAERAIARREKERRADARSFTGQMEEELELLLRLREALSRGEGIRELGLSDEELDLIKGYNFLTAKPVIYVANIGEEDIADGGPFYGTLAEAVGEDRIMPISAEIEAEIAELPRDERGEFLRSVGLSESGLSRLIRMGVKVLNLVTFYTIANEKLRAWHVLRGTRAPEAAGKIHTDMERGFIRAEVASYEDVLRYGTMAELHGHGLVRTEGRDYELADGDVVHFLFNV